MAGGRDEDMVYISSTEIYSTVQLKWNYGVQLPSARGYFSGISLNNNVFLLGKEDKILRHDKRTNKIPFIEIFSLFLFHLHFQTLSQYFTFNVI